MEEETSDHDPVEDEVLRKKNFDRGMGVDLDRFLIADPKPDVEEEKEEVVERYYIFCTLLCQFLV